MIIRTVKLNAAKSGIGQNTENDRQIILNTTYTDKINTQYAVHFIIVFFLFAIFIFGSPIQKYCRTRVYFITNREKSQGMPQNPPSERTRDCLLCFCGLCGFINLFPALTLLPPDPQRTGEAKNPMETISFSVATCFYLTVDFVKGVQKVIQKLQRNRLVTLIYRNLRSGTAKRFYHSTKKTWSVNTA